MADDERQNVNIHYSCYGSKLQHAKMGEEADEFKTPKKGSKVAKKLREFCTETTAHGLGRIASSTSRLERVIWSTCLLAAVVSMTYHGISLVSEYLTFPVDVKVELRYTNSQPFPAVVVCNMNSIKKSALKTILDDNGTVAILGMIENLHLNGTRRKLINSYKHALLATMNRTLQKSIGHQVEDLILDCEWNGEACGPQLVQ
ncbi:unnamed protein product [Porites evermanni]|uniref:Uncharacterized protein n=1 Tax=Porites evermanni TaxID=104178 RepID=A0ABN8M1R7_9CNID|nr:unnamed protein product [Porites evermanni]